MARTSQRLRIDIPFEDAIRKILKAGPMPKKPAGPKKPKRKARR